MASNLSLKSIFSETKKELEQSLSGLKLPKDSDIVQQQIAAYLNKVCDADSEFRQNLTQSEDYILQAALSMLNAQKDIASILVTQPSVHVDTPESKASSEDNNDGFSNLTVNATNGLIGAGGGALLGKFVLGGWGAVFGAIAGTAIVLYMSRQSSERQRPQSNPDIAATATIVNTPLNVQALLTVIEQICDSLDNLIATFRAQIKRVVTKYESIEKPTIEQDYRTLLEGIQSLVGFKRGHNATEDKYVGKIQERIEDLAELLDNYDLEVVDYTESNSAWFDAIESEKATEIKSVTPAIVKAGNVVLKGKIFTPQKQ
jgi:hypothetical protein